MDLNNVMDIDKGNIYFAIVCDPTSVVKDCFAISYTLTPILCHNLSFGVTCYYNSLSRV